MKIKYTIGNVGECTEDIVIATAPANGKLGGVAHQLYYDLDCDTLPERLLGKCVMVDNPTGLEFALLITRESRNDSAVFGKFVDALFDLKSQIAHNSIEIAMPKIGTGADRFEWEQVKNALEVVFADTDVAFNVYVLTREEVPEGETFYYLEPNDFEDDEACAGDCDNCKYCHDEIFTEEETKDLQEEICKLMFGISFDETLKAVNQYKKSTTDTFMPVSLSSMGE